jgi:hypothetical protein
MYIVRIFPVSDCSKLLTGKAQTTAKYSTPLSCFERTLESFFTNTRGRVNQLTSVFEMIEQI